MCARSPNPAARSFYLGLMKTIVLTLALVILSGCGTYHSLEQLEAEALRTGDWSAVELRERQMARRDPYRGLRCPPGEVPFCVTEFAQSKCTCIDEGRMRAFMDY